MYVEVMLKRLSPSRILTKFDVASGSCFNQSQSSAAGSLDDNSCLIESSSGDDISNSLHPTTKNISHATSKGNHAFLRK